MSSLNGSSTILATKGVKSSVTSHGVPEGLQNCGKPTMCRLHANTMAYGCLLTHLLLVCVCPRMHNLQACIAYRLVYIIQRESWSNMKASRTNNNKLPFSALAFSSTASTSRLKR